MVSLKFLTLLVDAGGFNEMFCVQKVVYVVLVFSVEVSSGMYSWSVVGRVRCC